MTALAPSLLTLYHDPTHARTDWRAALARGGELEETFVRWIGGDDEQRVCRLVERAGLPVEPPPTLPAARFLELMAVDKKVIDGSLRLVLTCRDKEHTCWVREPCSPHGLRIGSNVLHIRYHPNDKKPVDLCT